MRTLAIFDLSRGELCEVDAIYDRAALIALPEQLRNRYARHLVQITNRALQLLICVTYEQHLIAGPPFSVDAFHANVLIGVAVRLETTCGTMGLTP